MIEADLMPAKKTRRPALSEIGRKAADDAQRDALLEAGRRLEWNLSAMARELRAGNASHILRALDRLGILAVYEAERPARH